MSAAAKLPALALSLALAAWPNAGRADRATETSLCQPDTAVVFSCTTARGKVISLCGAPPTSLQYRFGTPGRVELAYPAEPAEGAKRMKLAQYARAQVQRTTVSFDNGEVSYTLFDGSERGVRQAGVSVQLPGERSERLFICRGPVTGALAPLKPHLPCDAESALQGGACR